MSTDCLFCRIIKQDIPGPLVLETDWAVAFADINPQAPTHFLIVPKRHTDSLADTSDPALLGHVLDAARQLAQQKGLTDYRTVINTGADAGQSVFHLHVHLLAGRPFSWPPG